MDRSIRQFLNFVKPSLVSMSTSGSCLSEYQRNNTLLNATRSRLISLLALCLRCVDTRAPLSRLERDPLFAAPDSQKDTVLRLIQPHSYITRIMFDRSCLPSLRHVSGQEIHRDQAVAFRDAMLPLASKLDTKSPNPNCFSTHQTTGQTSLATASISPHAALPALYEL